MGLSRVQNRFMVNMKTSSELLGPSPKFECHGSLLIRCHESLEALGQAGKRCAPRGAVSHAVGGPCGGFFVSPVGLHPFLITPACLLSRTASTAVVLTGFIQCWLGQDDKRSRPGVGIQKGGTATFREEACWYAPG